MLFRKCKVINEGTYKVILAIDSLLTYIYFVGDVENFRFIKGL